MSTAARETALAAAAHAVRRGADEVQVWVEDTGTAEFRAVHTGAVVHRHGRQRRTTVVARTGDRWRTEVTDGPAPDDPEPGGYADPGTHHDLLRRVARDAAGGRADPEVLGAESLASRTRVTALVDDAVTGWTHTRWRLWHWVGGTGGEHLEGSLARGDDPPDPEVPRRERCALLDTRGGSGPVHGRMRVLLQPAVALHLVDVLASVLNGQNVLGGMRMLAGRVGRRIASTAVGVVDDGRPDGPYGAVLDDEGTPTRRAVLIDGGVLRGFLHSRATAAACGAEPNGCAVRTLPGRLATPGPRGFTLLAGGTAEPRAALGDGLEAVAVSRSTVRPDGGRRIRLEVFGWVVRDGERVRPAGPVAVEVGVFEWLREVRACGPAVHHSAVFRGLAAPALLLDAADVGGAG